MPVIVVGADTAFGRQLIDRLSAQDREVRAFVSDPEEAGPFRQAGVKVAVGDVSDDSHVAGACLNVFSAVLVTAAATDGRVRSFAASEEAVLAGWAEAVVAAGARRVIWVGAIDPPATPGPEVAVVDPEQGDAVAAVLRLDEAASLT